MSHKKTITHTHGPKIRRIFSFGWLFIVLFAVSQSSCQYDDDDDMSVESLNDDQASDEIPSWTVNTLQPKSGLTIAELKRTDDALMDLRLWTSGHMIGRFDPSGRGKATETVFFEVRVGSEVPKSWREYYGPDTPTRFVDVRLIDADGRVFASQDGGPTDNTEQWGDPLNGGLVHVGDLENELADIAPRKNGGPEIVRQFEVQRLRQESFVAPLETIQEMVVSAPPRIEGMSEEVFDLVWDVARSTSLSLIEQVEPTEEDISIAKRNMVKLSQEKHTKSLPTVFWYHRASIYNSESGILYKHSALKRQRGMYVWFNNQFVFAPAYTGYTCNHGPCASAPAPAMVEKCHRTWAGRTNQVIGSDWNRTSIYPNVYGTEPSVGQCGGSVKIGNEWVERIWGWPNTPEYHVCHDDTWLQYKAIKYNTNYSADDISRCSDTIVTDRFAPSCV